MEAFPSLTQYLSQALVNELVISIIHSIAGNFGKC